MPFIYLDYAATAPLLKEAKNAMLDAFEIAGNPSSSHVAGQEAKAVLENARSTLASLVPCETQELLFMGSATECNNLVLSQLRKGEHLIVASTEHPSVLEPAKHLKTLGVKVTFLSVNASGRIGLPALENSIRKNTRLVSVMHANNETGILQQVNEIGEICRKKRVLFHTDAAQSFCREKLPDADFVTLSSHKIGGPKGIAALVARKPLPALLRGGGQEGGLRSGTPAVELAAGFAAAALKTIRNGQEKTRALRGFFEEKVNEIPGTLVHNKAPRTAHISSISFKGIDALNLVSQLSNEGICVSTGSACHENKLEGSRVMQAMGFGTLAKSTIRASIGHSTRKAELQRAFEILKEVIPALRRAYDSN